MCELKRITCPYCEGYGYTIEVRATCCGNIKEYGDCCGVPEPEQYQKECPCDNGTILIETKQTTN